MDYKVCGQNALRGACGLGLVCAGYDIARGNTESRVGKLVLAPGTEKKVTWQRGLAGGAVALSGALLAFGRIPFLSR